MEEGDDIMTDGGFIIDDLLAEKKATLNMPPSKNSKIYICNDVQDSHVGKLVWANIVMSSAVGREPESQRARG